MNNKKEPLTIILEDKSWSSPDDYILANYSLSKAYLDFDAKIEKTCRKMIKKISRKNPDGLDAYNQSYADALIKYANEREVARIMQQHKDFRSVINSKIFELERNKVAMENRLYEGIPAEREWISQEISKLTGEL